MNHLRKIEKIIDLCMTEDLSEYEKIVSKMNKKLPFLVGSKRVAAALLREHIGSLSNFDISSLDLISRSKEDSGKLHFDDIKDGRARLFINIGKNHKVSTGDLIREIVKRSGIDGKTIGKIDIHATYSFFEVPEQYAELVYHSFENAKIRGISVVVEPAKRKKG